MLEMNNDSNSFLDEFEEEGKDIIIEGTDDDSVEIVNDNKNINKDVTNDIKTITEIEVEDEEADASSDDTDNSSEEETEDGEKFSYKAFLSHLNDEGVISFEDKEDLPDTPEVVYESVKKTITDGINSYKESIPEEGQKFLDYLEKGGDPKRYIDTLQAPIDLQAIDLDLESDQEKVLREYLKTQDYTPEEIDETITDYKDNLLLDKQSKVAAKKLEKTFEKRNEILLQEQEQVAEQQREQYNNYINTINNGIDTSDSLAGLEVTKAEKDSFKKYLLVRGKDGLTDYEREYQQDPVKTQLELAYLKFKKYDFGSAKKAGESAAVKQLNWKLKNNESTIKGGKSSQEVKQESDLSAFRSFMNKKKD